MSAANTHSDLSGRILAVVVFLVGIGLLCFVFSLAWSLFRSPVAGLELPVKAGAAAPPAAGIGIALTALARQLLLLAVMTLAGSLIAGKGLHLYFTVAHGGTRPEATPQVSQNGSLASPQKISPAEGAAKTPPI